MEHGAGVESYRAPEVMIYEDEEIVEDGKKKQKLRLTGSGPQAAHTNMEHGGLAHSGSTCTSVATVACAN